MPVRGKPSDPALRLSDEDLAAMTARAPVVPILVVGFGGLLVMLWLMVVKPF
jgi:hypothetical protein